MYQIGGDTSLEKIVSLDESLILYDDSGRKICVVGKTYTASKEIRFDAIIERT